MGDQSIVEQIESDDETVALGLKSVSKKSQKTKSYTVARKLELRRTRDTVKGGQKRNLAGAGRPLLDKDFDMLLAGWVQERRTLKMKVSRTMIMARDQQILQPAIGLEKETKFAVNLFTNYDRIPLLSFK
uniref:Uncharacterized protein n=1 Tax=Ditylenchus dipsaci TaxID=166011 RepID=A0A915DBS4_9BILA